MITTHTETNHDLDVMEVDISDSDTLFERYGVRIPVLQHPDGRELDWPFTEVGAAGFFRVLSLLLFSNADSEHVTSGAVHNTVSR